MSIARTVLGRIYFALIRDLPSVVLELAEKARLISFVTGRGVSALLDCQQYRVLVAVDPDLVNDLEVPGLFSLAPQFVARAREVTRAPGRHCLFKRLTIHVREHQHAMACMIHGYRRNYAAILVEIYRR
jgi:hypothetical protein